MQSKGLSRVFSNTTVKKHQFFGAQLTVQLSHPYMTTGKTIALTRGTFFSKVMSLLLNMLSRLVITFLPRSQHLLISWLQSPSSVILEPQNIKSDTVSTVSPSRSHYISVNKIFSLMMKKGFSKREISYGIYGNCLLYFLGFSINFKEF